MTVYRIIKSGELPAVRVGRSFRVRDVDVDTYLGNRYTRRSPRPSRLISRRFRAGPAADPATSGV